MPNNALKRQRQYRPPLIAVNEEDLINYDKANEYIRIKLNQTINKLAKENDKLKESLGIAIKALYDIQTWLTCDPDDIKELIPDFCAEQKALEIANAAIEKIIYRRQPDTSK